MKPEFFTGIEAIDVEHKKLFKLASDAYDLIKAEFIPDKYDNIKTLLNELEDYVKVHFAHEEAYMESINYKRIGAQKIEHRAFENKLSELNNDDVLETDTEKTVEETLTYLTNWLFNHILTKDKLIGH
jgi:hemerythrin